MDMLRGKGYEHNAHRGNLVFIFPVVDSKGQHIKRKSNMGKA